MELVRHPVPGSCRILGSNVQGLSRNLSYLTVASSQNDLLLCSETLVLDRHHIRVEHQLTAMAAMQAADVHASFLFMNGNQEWLGSTTTKCHGIAAIDLQLYQVVINWCLAKLMHVDELLTS